MALKLKEKAFLGLGGVFIPLPLPLLRSQARKSARLICRETGGLTPEERRLHRYVVNQVTKTGQPVRLEEIETALDVSADWVQDTVEKLESLKVFLYREGDPGINWAYPVTAVPNQHQLVFEDGSSCTAA